MSCDRPSSTQDEINFLPKTLGCERFYLPRNAEANERQIYIHTFVTIFISTNWSSRRWTLDHWDCPFTRCPANLLTVSILSARPMDQWESGSFPVMSNLSKTMRGTIVSTLSTISGFIETHVECNL